MHSSPLGKPGSKDTGGMSTYLRELSTALGRLGCRVDLFTGVGGGARGRITEVGPGSRLIYLPAGSGDESKFELRRFTDQFAEDVDQYCRENKQCYDLIFSHYWLSGLAGRLLRELWGVPHLVMFHTLGAVKKACCSGENEPELRIRAEEALARECDRVITAAFREKEALLRYCYASPDKVAVIPCGVNLDLFKPLPPGPARNAIGPGEGKVILYVGRIEPVKDLDLLIRAAACLHVQGHAFRLLIAGGDEHGAPAVRRYRQLAQELGISELVSFPGLVDHRKLPLYYSAANVTVVPSFYESFGLTALESLACGTPVAATDVGDLKKIILRGKTGMVIGGRTPELLAEALASLITLPAKPSALCRDSVQSYAWPEIARRMVEEFRKLCS